MSSEDFSQTAVSADAISAEMMERFKADFRSVPHRRALMNAVRKSGIQATAWNQDAMARMTYTFSNEIETGEITSQKQSGRCWMFAGLNTLRVHTMRQLNLKTFEFSQAYLMFWDKLEKANYFLENILETLDEETGSRVVAWLLSAPLNDGGQWDMFVNLVRKYGVVPKSVMPETFHSSSSGMMNRLLTLKLREHAATLRRQHQQGASLAELRAQKQAMLNEIHRMLCIFLGEPPERFDFEYRDKDNQFRRDAGLTPHQFLERYVPVDLDEYVSVIHAPTADKPFGKMYTVKYLGNVKGGRDVLYVNVDIETLKQAALRQLLDGEPVWFGCDVGKMYDRDTGILDTSLYDYAAALDVDFQLSKADRLDYGESLMTHAMVFTGVNVADGRPNRWKVENSWGKEPGQDGYFVMSDAWFDEFLYQVVVKKKYLPEEVRAVLKEEPVVLPPWDPMGSLAIMR
ncbi:aminopeptidase C [Alicyclobacillus macrosporangiidus]|uniref:aminopeptidase C n=1 Tax=Alicyclobacillus macrosporangiidus TaxID=392015 RepID=UPI0006892C56|nr:C1 family peptidase [Alicyclobacillus macrosporangiidus]